MTDSMPVTYVRDDKFSAILRESEPTVGGSREHFFHFLLGYLLPVVHEQSRHPGDSFRVLTCGPLMDPILVETLRGLDCDFEVVPNAEISNPVVVAGWDYGWTSGADTERAVDLVRRAWSNSAACGEPDCPSSSRLLLARSPEHPFFAGAHAELSGYGLGRRGVVNWTEVSEHLHESGIEHELYEPGRHTLGCQIECFTRATHVVGMRGAEWVNLIWTRSPVAALVFDPGLPGDLLKRLLAALDCNAEVVAVSERNYTADPEQVAQFLTAGAD